MKSSNRDRLIVFVFRYILMFGINLSGSRVHWSSGSDVSVPRLLVLVLVYSFYCCLRFAIRTKCAVYYWHFELKTISMRYCFDFWWQGMGGRRWTSWGNFYIIMIDVTGWCRSIVQIPVDTFHVTAFHASYISTSNIVSMAEDCLGMSLNTYFPAAKGLMANIIIINRLY